MTHGHDNPSAEGRRRGEPAILITGAPPSPQAELNYRRRRYAITMGVRVVCLILAAAFHATIWLWPIFAVGAVALPWIAVLLANDRLPPGSRFERYAGDAPRTISTTATQQHNQPGSSRVIDE